LNTLARGGWRIHAGFGAPLHAPIEQPMMKKERRNYYRLLHVQPEAPQAIITASYRSLMTKERCHPDLGGDHDTAALINQAYAVLKDPEKRNVYDRTLNQIHRGSSPHQRPSAPGARAGTTAEAHRKPSSPENACPFCTSPAPKVIAADTRCSRCYSPLAPIANRLASKRELLGRRTSMRVTKHDTATLYPGWNQHVANARLRDLSPTGISLFTVVTLAPRTVVRVVAPSYDFLVSVVQTRPHSRDGIHIIHARLLTALFEKKSAVFVAMSI
jgi:hypothetical protein